MIALAHRSLTRHFTAERRAAGGLLSTLLVRGCVPNTVGLRGEHDGQHGVDEMPDGQIVALRDFQFQTLVLSAKANEEQVANVFVRINSEGVQLKQADFILTLCLSTGRRDADNSSCSVGTRWPEG